MKILMFTIGYPPTHVGGTEVYVAGLVEALRRRGHQAEVAYVEEIAEGPGITVHSTRRGETPVHAIVVPRSRYRLELVSLDARTRADLVGVVRRLVDEIAPDVVHVHPLQLGLEADLLDACRRDGYPVVLTYHSATTTCARGDLVRLGREVCDGLILQVRCTACLMHRKGVPRLPAELLARLPVAWYGAAHRAVRAPSLQKLRSLLSLPVLVEERRRAWARAVNACDRVVAVCDWVRRVCAMNGVADEKLVLSRHGQRLASVRQGLAPVGPAHFGFLGRLSPEKGVEVLLEAILRAGPDARFEIEFVSATFGSRRRSPEEERVVQAVRMAARGDRRLRILGSVPEARLGEVLASWDALVVPSLWLESGPQVVYEAFAVQTPVIGSRRGGIAELVRDGETGFLFTAGDAGELAGLLRRFAVDPGGLRALRPGIPAPRTTDDVAADMLAVYQAVLSAGGLRQDGRPGRERECSTSSS